MKEILKAVRWPLSCTLSLSLLAACQFPTMQTPAPTGQAGVQEAPAPAPETKTAQLKVNALPKVGRSLSRDGRPWSFGRPTAKQLYLAKKHGLRGGMDLPKPGKFKVLSHGECPPHPWGPRGAPLSDNRLGWYWGEGIQVNSVPEGICEYINWPVYGQQDHWVYVTDDIVELYAEYWGADPHTVWYLGYFEFQPLFPPSPSPSPTPSPEPTPDPTPEPTPSPPPSATPTPPPASPPPPPPPPPPTPEPPYMKMKAQEVLSPNGDGKFDTAQVEIESNVTWELSLDEPQHLIKVGQGDAKGDDAVVWNGTGKSGVLPHGEYLLRLHPTKAALDDLYAEVYVDTKGPEATEIKFEQRKLDASKNAYAFKGSALLKDVGYSEVAPDTIKVTVDDQEVAHQFDSATGKLNFEGSVAIDAPQTQVHVKISAQDQVANNGSSEKALGIVPLELIIDPKDNAFSPNGDNSRDKLHVEIRAAGPWTIEVDGNPGAIDTGDGENSGNKVFDWSGAVNGKVLADGRYTLRLNDGTEEVTADVIVDNQKPTVSDFQLQSSQNSTEPGRFTISAMVQEIGLAGIDPSSIRILVPGSSQPPSYDSASGSLSCEVSIIDTRLARGGGNAYRLASTASDFLIGVEVTDRAGNMATGGIQLPQTAADAMLGAGQRLAWAETSPDAPSHVLDRSLDKYILTGAVVVYGGGAIALADTASAYAFVWIATKFGLDRALAAAAVHRTLAFLLDETGSVPGPKPGKVAIDTNVVIYLAEGHPTLFIPALTALAGRQPSISRQAIHEYLRGGGDPNRMLKNGLCRASLSSHAS